MICRVCKTDKPKVEFSRTRKDCKICHNKSSRLRYDELRNLVLQHYGGNPPKCHCCSVTERDFLTLDHVVPVKRFGRDDPNWRGGHRLVRELIRRGFPEGFVVECYNCNCASGFRGICPHKRAAVDAAMHRS